jgi:hypothetical protein
MAGWAVPAPTDLSVTGSEAAAWEKTLAEAYVAELASQVKAKVVNQRR